MTFSSIHDNCFNTRMVWGGGSMGGGWIHCWKISKTPHWVHKTTPVKLFYYPKSTAKADTQQLDSWFPLVWIYAFMTTQGAWHTSIGSLTLEHIYLHEEMEDRTALVYSEWFNLVNKNTGILFLHDYTHSFLLVNTTQNHHKSWTVLLSLPNNYVN